MPFGSRMVETATARPKTVTGLMILLTFILAALAALPSLWPETFPFLSGVAVDTDPENMLREDEPHRVFHREMKERMSLYDMVVVGVVNDVHPDGVFNPDSLRRIYALAEFARDELRWEEPEGSGNWVGVIGAEMIAPSNVDNIEQQDGALRFEWLMPEPPKTQTEALAVRDKALKLPFLHDTLVSGNGKALAIYLPLTSKDLSYRVYDALQKEIAEFDGDDQFHITGLPVAEDTFGVEMFKQMAISAPIAMLIIFLLMLVFFRKLVVIVSPLIVAMVSVICTMGLLIAAGKTVHIMSSMIPIFIMPIAVLDAVHILSEFFDRYPVYKDRKKAIHEVMETLFTPMLYTSLTTAAGFASLALTPIPPVQVFGLFIAFGVMMAWVLTVTFIPAYVMFIPERSLANFGHKHATNEVDHSLLGRLLAGMGRFTYRHAKLIMLMVAALIVVSVVGIGKIRINDNPIKWFTPKHPIRIADQKLNENFGGTYMGYLALSAPKEAADVSGQVDSFVKRMQARAEALEAEGIPIGEEVLKKISAMAHEQARSADSRATLLDALAAFTASQAETAPFDEIEAWTEMNVFVDSERQRSEVFKRPEVLHYTSALQAYLATTGVVGKSNSLADLVKTVNRELFSGEEKDFRIPETPQGVGTCVMQFQNGHRPNDLWHFVTKDFRTSVLWVQLRSGDNRDMARVVKSVDDYVRNNPPPEGIVHEWFGLTYINVVWQEKMVSGMLQAFLGSFLVVLLMMTVLFRSALWGLLCMVPLAVTIGLIYGAIGLVGKDYDMPVAVLSSLSLGLAVDYAIHFLSRTRQLHAEHGSWKAAAGPVFGEPARAITRNVIVIGVGFLPLLAAPLVPYQTVGIFIAAILIAAGVATLFILPALVKLFEKWLFPSTAGRGVTCLCGTCVISAVTLVAVVAINMHQFLQVRMADLAKLSVAAAFVLAGACAFVSRRKQCKVPPIEK